MQQLLKVSPEGFRPRKGLLEPGKPRLEVPNRHVLIPGETVDWRIPQVGDMVSDYIETPGPPVVFLVALKGGTAFWADLNRNVVPNHRTSFMRTSRYHGGTSGVKPELSPDGVGAIKGHRIVIVDDIGDERVTLEALRDWLIQNGAEEVKTCVMLNKFERKTSDIPLDFVGFDIANVFVWGRGLDGGDDTEEKRNDYDVCYSLRPDEQHPAEDKKFSVPTVFPR